MLHKWQQNKKLKSSNVVWSDTLARRVLYMFYKVRLTVYARCLPSVCAADAGAAVTDDIENIEPVNTTLDQLASARPKVFITDDEVKAFIENEKARDRVVAMFVKDNNGDMSGDLASVIQVAQTCGFFFFLVTSVAGGLTARERYLEKNKSTVYATKFQALRAYNDAIFFGSMKFGLKWGLKSALFAGLFMLTAQTVAVYRNRTSILDFVAGGGLTCALLRMNMGLRGMFAGGVIGSGLGLIGGTAMCSLLYFTNETQQHRHFLHVHQLLREKRETEMLSVNVTAQPAPIIGDAVK